MTERFRVIRVGEAKKQGLPGFMPWQDEWAHALYDFSTQPPVLIAVDNMQPEDANFLRDMEWVPELLNELTRPVKCEACRDTGVVPVWDTKRPKDWHQQTCPACQPGAHIPVTTEPAYQIVSPLKEASRQAREALSVLKRAVDKYDAHKCYASDCAECGRCANVSIDVLRAARSLADVAVTTITAELGDE